MPPQSREHESNPPHRGENQDHVDEEQKAVGQDEPNDEDEPSNQGDSDNQEHGTGTEPTSESELNRISRIKTFDKLSKAIARTIAQRKKDGEGMAGEIRDLPFLKADVRAKKAASEQDVRPKKNKKTGARKGQTEESKAAHKEFMEAKKLLDRSERKLKKRGKVDLRNQEDRAFMTEQSSLEDFLYYQNPENRKERSRMLDDDPPTRAEPQSRRPYLLHMGEYFDWLRTVIDSYDDQGIGTTNHQRVRPDELHLRTQPARREPVGLGSSAYVPRRPRMNLRLDDQAIEVRRLEVETLKHPDDPSDVLTHDNRRQNEQRRYGRGTAHRPTTSNLRVETVGRKQETEDLFKKIRTSTGLFIAAKESSWDWLTSYDCLDKVKTVEVPEVFTESSEADNSDWVFDRPKDDDGGKMSVSKGVEKPDPVVGSSGEDYEEEDPNVVTTPDDNIDETAGLNLTKRTTHPRAVKNKPKYAGIDTEKPVPDPEGIVKSKGTEKPKVPPGKEEKSEEGDLSKSSNWKQVRAQIDVPYLRSEFTRASRGATIGETRYQVTPWAEETTGRRERHDYRLKRPSSPVYSPPLLPLKQGVINDGDIPVGFSLTDTKPSPLEPGSRQKCLINPQRCRAWWNPHHSKEDCWITYPERPTRPDNPTRWPILSIDVPKGSPSEYMPADVRAIYRSRLHDHYGLAHQPSSKQYGHQWPRIGVRVPYEPMTFDDMRLGTQSSGAVATVNTKEPRTGRGKAKAVHPPHPEGSKGVKRPLGEDDDLDHSEDRPSKKPNPTPEQMTTEGEKIRAVDASLRTAHEMRSLAVPIIEVETHWGWFPGDDDDDVPDPKAQEESEDEGDLFTTEYQTRSFPEGRPGPAGKSDKKAAQTQTHATLGDSVIGTTRNKALQAPPPRDSNNLYNDPRKEPAKDAAAELGRGKGKGSNKVPDRVSGKDVPGETALQQGPRFLTTAEEDDFSLVATDDEIRQRYYGTKPDGGLGQAATSDEAPQDSRTQDDDDNDSLYDD